jgi:hypothetical protein
MHRLRIHPFSLRLILCIFSTACIGTAFAGHVEPSTVDCQTGAYRFQDGEIVDIAQSEGKTLRWRKFDGTTGVLHKKDDASWTSHWDGQIVQMDTRRLSLVARRVKSNSTVRKLTGSHSM